MRNNLMDPQGRINYEAQMKMFYGGEKKGNAACETVQPWDVVSLGN